MKLYWRYKKNGKWTWIAADTRRNPENPKHEVIVRMEGLQE